MSDLNKMTGTPWHIEKIHRQDGDERRHRSKCIYYSRKYKLCNKRKLACIGSAHCNYYKEESVQLKTTEIVLKSPYSDKNAKKRKLKKEAKKEKTLLKQKRLFNQMEILKQLQLLESEEKIKDKS